MQAQGKASENTTFSRVYDSDFILPPLASWPCGLLTCRRCYTTVLHQKDQNAHFGNSTHIALFPGDKLLLKEVQLASPPPHERRRHSSTKASPPSESSFRMTLLRAKNVLDSLADRSSERIQANQRSLETRSAGNPLLCGHRNDRQCMYANEPSQGGSSVRIKTLSSVG